MDIAAKGIPSLKGRVAVVTGASSGFGRGIAVAFGRAGMKVVVGDLTAQTAPGNFDEAPKLTTTALIERDGGAASFITCDVAKAADANALIAHAVQAFGRIDVVVNNAGVWRGGPFHEVSEAAFDACANVSVKGSWLVSQAAIRQFLAQNGRAQGGSGNVINIVSTAGLRPHQGQPAYNVAKAAQANLTRCMALEYGREGIRVNGICPTYMKTAMSRGGFEHPATTEMVQRVIPMGRWGEVDDVAELALYLASDASAFINGALIPLDGGETLGALRFA
ncbi:MAG TPA: SDR family oxidoreductase [Caulobacteraceae bacterium]|nr:SDR family oxidoreductase [Caulobacteraceae bacterium]